MKTLKDVKRIYITDEMVEKGYQRTLYAPDPIARAATLERRGGPCPICGTAFNLVIVDNEYGCFNYYQPSCRCFKRCDILRFPHGTVQGCGRWLIAETLAGIAYCTSCFAEDPNKKKKPALPKPIENRRIGKDAAAGD